MNKESSAVRDVFIYMCLSYNFLLIDNILG